ncbi:MAG: hypothetical protein IKH44_05560 [Bacteroidales bacterium]|nr:hypothetical protein [Bacteroidales bacterium]
MCEIIKTGIDGLDAILNGGIVYEDSVVVIIKGRRGIFKTLLGMQAMLGIQKSFETNHPQNEFPIRFYSLNKNNVILERMLKGMVISREVENIKKGRPNNLRSYLDNIGGGYAAFEEDIRHLLLTFDSNTDRFLRGEEVTPITIKSDIAGQIKLTLKGCGSSDSGSDYLQPGLVDFASKMDDIVGLPTESDRRQACIVVDGISRMTDEELERLPMEALKQSLRQRAKISILIMNDREPLRNLDADIIIDMRQNYDTVHNYTFHELNIAKNVKGQFAFGWQKYKPMNGLLYVYPSIHKLLSQQYSVDNTFIQAISTDGRYAQPFASMSEDRVPPLSLGEGPAPMDYPDRRISENEKRDTPATKDDILPKLITPHRVNKSRVTTIIGNHNTFKRFLASITILNSIMSGHEVLVLLLNERRRGMMDLIDKIRKDAGINAEDAAEAYQRLFFWEVRMGCISPEELISFVMEYIQMQKNICPKKRIDIFFIDLATVEQCFPMINNESLFIPTLSTLCRERKVDLHFVCNKHFARRSTVCTVSDTLICTERENDIIEVKKLGTETTEITEDAKKEAKKGAKKEMNEEVEQETVENKKEETVTYDVTHLTLYLEKNDFGPRFNCRIFRMDADNLFVKDLGDIMRFNVRTDRDGMVVFDVETNEISTMKDYWRNGVNVFTM